MKKDNNTIPSNITSEYIDLLKKEGNKALATCLDINNDQEFIKSIPTIIDDSYQAVKYKAEHLLLRDIVKVFNDFADLYSDPINIPAKAKFLLIYFFEKLQGKDLSETYDHTKLNQLILSDQFDKNVKIIRETSFIKSAEYMKDEFLMPALLVKTKNNHLMVISSFLNRAASLIVKADNIITEKEEVLLKQVSNKIYNPTIKGSTAHFSEIPENDTLELVLQELHELIGMEAIKKNVEDIANFLKVQKMREEKGLKNTNNALHAVFMGPPGTGKTTVARLLGRIYKHLGYLKKGHLVETDRAGMVAGYVGQTAIKADEIIKSAIGGVLFIDEAYSLNSGSFNDFGKEAIEILLKRMEDQRGELVVIVAGYPDEMESFIQSNPGLQSRFNRYFKFGHFEVDALLKIFKLNAEKADFVLTEDAEAKLTEILERVHEKRHKAFGNARTVRNLFEKIIECQANRIVSISPITEETLRTLTEEDVPEILQTVKEIILFEEEEES